MSSSSSPFNSTAAVRIEETLATLDDTTLTFVLPVIVAAIVFGMFTLLIIFSTYIMIRRGLTTPERKFLLVVTLAMYIVSAMQLGLDIESVWNDLVVQVRSVALTGAQTPTNPAIHSMDSALVSINIVLSDAVVLWRACIVWEKNRAVVISSVVLAFVILAFNVFVIIQDEIASLKTVRGDIPVVPLVSLCVSLLSNVWSTVLIAYRALVSRREFKKDGQGNKSTVVSVLLLLVESSFLYCCIWTLNIIANITPLLGSFGPYLIHIVTQLTAMYPTLIILIVFLRKSHGYGNSELPPDATMAFAHPAGVHPSQQAQRSQATSRWYTSTFDLRSFAISNFRGQGRESSYTRNEDVESYGGDNDSRKEGSHTPRVADELSEGRGERETVDSATVAV